MLSQEVESQAINVFVNDVHKLGPERFELRRINHALEYRVLNALTHLLTFPGNAPEARTTRFVRRLHIVAHQDHHSYYLGMYAG
jgi:Mn-dependent DtxR family transcriptional regulator